MLHSEFSRWLSARCKLTSKAIMISGIVIVTEDGQTVAMFYSPDLESDVHGPYRNLNEVEFFGESL